MKKKITFFSLIMLAFIGYLTIANVYALKTPHPRSFDDNICYSLPKDGSPCSGSPLNCTCSISVNQNFIIALNNAISNNAISDFFSSSSNVTALGLYPDQLQELTTPGCWILQHVQQDGVIYFAVGLSPKPSFDNADFILNINLSNN
jgi:hypothetical protein